MPDTQHNEMGDFLRSRRHALSPTEVGIANGRRRRTAGLRREEVAELAGIGVDWYVRLEQGRAVSPSASTIDSLAIALRLSKAEHAHLSALTQHAGRRPFVLETVPATLRRLVHSLNQPAYITGRRWDILAWNSAADHLFGFSAVPDSDRNILLCVLTRPAGRQLFGAKWADEARRMVAQFRATHDLWAGDPAFIQLLDKLHSGCAEFSRWWQAHEVRSVSAGKKQLVLPNKGLRTFEYATFQANDDPALRLAIYTALD